jgi:hypothetical protein
MNRLPFLVRKQLVLVRRRLGGGFKGKQAKRFEYSNSIGLVWVF